MSTKYLSTVFLAGASILIVSILNVEAKKRPKWWMTTSKPVPTARPRTQPEIEALLKKDGIIPDVIKYAPNDTVQVVYNNNETVVDFGNELTFKDVKNAPTFVDWFLHDEYEVYTLMLLGPDSPTRENPSNRCYKHWLVANIPEERIYAAEEFASYTISTRAYEPGRYLTQSYYTQLNWNFSRFGFNFLARCILGKF
nr:PREDICTED: OV-16 antigen-like [Bemisia tabaci]XP_018915349.1 PREDICTED: OV-16 antigen-like [Bemisia tabaci]